MYTFKNFSLLKLKKIDLYLISIFSAVYSIFAILALIKTLYYLNKSHYPLAKFPYFISVLDWFTVIITMTYIAINTRHLIKVGWRWKKIIIKHLIIIIFVNSLIRVGVEMYLFSQVNELSNITVHYLFDRMMAYIDINYLIYFVMIFIIYGYYYNEKINQSKDRERILENQLLNTKLQFLNSQIQPHFLFNSLNSIVHYISDDKDKAVNMIIDLSDYLRQTLNLNNTHYIMLNQELKILKLYLNLQKTRFGNQINIHQNIEMEALNVLIPPFILQPIIENSIKHGFSPEKKTLLIQISISINGKALEIIIENNGKPLKEGGGILTEGTGLNNIYSRLKTLYGKEFQIHINGTASGASTCIKLPIKR